jgi:hypothetical protein
MAASLHGFPLRPLPALKGITIADWVLLPASHQITSPASEKNHDKAVLHFSHWGGAQCFWPALRFHKLPAIDTCAFVLSVAERCPRT